MSNIDYTQICPEFYTNYEDGCCMENCTFESKGYCPVRYVKGLLEEKDKVIENWQTMYESVMQTCGNDAKEIKKLKKQNDDYADSLTKVLNENADLVFKLAEKEKENELMAKTLKMTKFIEKEVCQDKISFAVEQLEKVKEKANEKQELDWGMGFRYKDHWDIITDIDNQIKQLKEGK